MHRVMPVIAAGVSLVAAGVIAATQTAPSLPDATMPAVQLTSGETTSDTLTGLLNTATTNYTDAYNVAAGMFTDVAVPVGSTSDFGLMAAQAESLSQSMVQITADLSRDQAAIDSQAGSLSGLFDQFWFEPLDQQEATLGGTMLTDIQTLDAAAQAYDSAATSANTWALEAAAQAVNADNWDISLLTGEAGSVFDVANLLALLG